MMTTMRGLTAWYDNPDKVHEEVISPEIISFRTAICEPLMVVVKHAGGIVQDVAVYLT